MGRIHIQHVADILGVLEPTVVGLVHSGVLHQYPDKTFNAEEVEAYKKQQDEKDEKYLLRFRRTREKYNW